MPTRARDREPAAEADRARGRWWCSFGLTISAGLLAACSTAMRPAEGITAHTGAREVMNAPAAVESTDTRSLPQDEPSGPATQNDADMPEGVFHRVESGQTLWRIARAYGIDLRSLAEANQLSDPRAVATGRMLFIPGASVPLVVPPYPAPAPVAAAGPRPSSEVTRDEIRAEPQTFIWPVAGGEIISAFGVPRRTHQHAGIDIRGARGQEVRAAGRGEVVFSGVSPGGYGKLVILDHGNGLQTFYAHNSKISVKNGEVVEPGQEVGRIGRTGNATTEHCHFEVRKDGVAMDPLELFPDVSLTASRAEDSVENPARESGTETGGR